MLLVNLTIILLDKLFASLVLCKKKYRNWLYQPETRRIQISPMRHIIRPRTANNVLRVKKIRYHSNLDRRRASVATRGAVMTVAKYARIDYAQPSADGFGAGCVDGQASAPLRGV